MVKPLPLVLLAALVLALGGRADAGDPEPPLVVHEWGTFTSMQGSDGIGLEGLHHEEEGLPDFVYSRTEVRECPLRSYGYKGLEMPVERVTEKMETPVIYFHTDVPRRVQVRVDFVDGLLTQWYPVSDRLGPPELDCTAGPLDLTTVERSFLSWDLELVPASAGVPAGIPTVSPHDPWAYAREVDCASVRTMPREAPERMGPTESEQYVFYRGLGTFSLPVRVETKSDAQGTLVYDGDQPLESVYVLRAYPNGSIGMLRLGTVHPGERREFDLNSVKALPNGRALQDVYAKELVARGLFADEARAMVRTWSRQWFTSEGTRVLYVVPRELTDRVLPLTITPTPDALVRVLVGRLEFLTPETESEVREALANLQADTEALRTAATARLERLGRFLEPHLRRVLSTAEDETVRTAAEALLADLAAETGPR